MTVTPFDWSQTICVLVLSAIFFAMGFCLGIMRKVAIDNDKEAKKRAEQKEQNNV